jgi:hypothetical protein
MSSSPSTSGLPALPSLVRCSSFINEDLFPSFDSDPNRFLTLYATNVELGSQGGGLICNSRRHRATVVLHTDNLDYVLPPEEHEDLWFPLETVLSNWIEMVCLGEMVAVPKDTETPNDHFGVWSWKPYSLTQMDNGVAAFDRLVTAIEERIPAGSSTAT